MDGGAAALLRSDVAPGPLTVFAALQAEWGEGYFGHMAATLARVAAAFAIAMAAGSAIGIALGV